MEQRNALQLRKTKVLNEIEDVTKRQSDLSMQFQQEKSEIHNEMDRLENEHQL